MSILNICQQTISISSVTLAHLMLTSQSTVANPVSLQSLSISQPTVTPNWLSMGKFQCCLPWVLKRDRLSNLLKNGQ
ncbi:MAG: hypothetical protein ACRC80_26995 [Waterburya sp.]